MPGLAKGLQLYRGRCPRPKGPLATKIPGRARARQTAGGLKGRQRRGYTSGMESTSSRSVNDLPATERQVLEGMLGQSLSPGQRVFIMAYTPSAVPEDSVREAGRQRLLKTFEKVDQHAAHGSRRRR